MSIYTCQYNITYGFTMSHSPDNEKRGDIIKDWVHIRSTAFTNVKNDYTPYMFFSVVYTVYLYDEMNDIYRLSCKCFNE